MKTIRTILATLAGVLLIYGLVALTAVNAEAAFVQRSLYQIFTQSYFVTLVLGVAFLLVAILLTIAVVSFKDKRRDYDDDDLLDDDEDDEDDLSMSSLYKVEQQGRSVPPRERTLTQEEEAFTRRMPTVRTAQFLAEQKRVQEQSFDRPEIASAAKVSAPTPPKAAAFCPHCGEELAGATQYCPACGKKVSRAD